MKSAEEKIAAEYRRLICEWDAAATDAKRANRLYDTRRMYYKKIRDTDEGRAAIISLLDDEDVAVRVVSAINCLFIDPDRARAILQFEATGGSRHAINAMYSLQAFDEGTLSLD